MNQAHRLTLNLAIKPFLEGKSEIGLIDVQRHLSNNGWEHGLGREIAGSLTQLGWMRDGWLYTGYERTARWVRRHSDAL